MRPRWISYRKKHPEWGRCMAFAMIFRGAFYKDVTDSIARHPNGGSAVRGKYFSALGGASALRRSSVSRRSLNENIAASVVSEECKEEERPEDVAPTKERFVDVEDGTSSSVRVTRSILSSDMPTMEEGSFHDADEGDKKVHFDDEDKVPVQEQ